VLTKYAFGAAPFFIVHSEEDRRNLLTLKRDAVVRRGYHPTYAEFGGLDESKREARAALGIPAGRRTLLFFGLIRAYKGLQYLIEAMSIVREHMDCLLLVVGEFYEDKSKYLDLIERRSLGEHVRVIDRYVPNEEVARYFVGSDVAVLPYVTATQSGIVQIAFGVGTPVITTRVGGLPEAVDDGVTGIVVEPENPAALAAAICRYYEDGLQERFREQIERRKARFQWSEEVRLIDELIERARA
jgi:glycosyltransferase involved in cell wall biosynthesis